MSFEYPEKIRFKCLKCGICCGNTPERTRHILLLDKEAQGIAKSVNKSVSDIVLKVEGTRPYSYEMKKNTTNGKCIFLKENRCVIYPKRPLICRFYPFGLENGQKQRQKVFFFTNECPGIGKGRTMEESDFRRLLKRAEKRTMNRGSVEP
jgi:Fe-S-cluster containining protein